MFNTHGKVWLIGVAACALLGNAFAQEPIAHETTRSAAESTDSIPAAALFALVEAPDWRPPSLPENATLDLRQAHVYFREEWQLTADFVWQEAENGFDWHLEGYRFDRLPESVVLQGESR